MVSNISLSVRAIDKSDAMIDLVTEPLKQTQGDGWKWDASSHVLTLNGINLNVKDEEAAINLPLALDPNDEKQFTTIVLTKGSVNNISLHSSKGKDNKDMSAILGNGNLRIEGEGTLNVVSGSMLESNSTNVQQSSVAIGSGQILEIVGGLIYATSGDVSGEDALSAGISAFEEVRFNGDCELFAQSGKVKTTGIATAVYCNGFIGNGNITVTNNLQASLAPDYSKTIVPSNLNQHAVYMDENNLVNKLRIGCMHEWGSWLKNNENEHIRECKKNSKHKQIEKHSWDLGVITKDATINETGIKTFTCNKCQAKKTLTIPKLTEIIKEPQVKPQEEPKQEVIETKPEVKPVVKSQEEKQEVIIETKPMIKVDHPNTSDDTNINAWMIIMSISMIGLLSLRKLQILYK
ncbi:MAG: hypothetical protein RSF38_06975 [Erysipelotrichaceae bacterium]